MGTWSSPDTKEKANELKTLMEAPILQEGATKKLYHFVGDDDLFDKIDGSVKGEDVRQLIAETLEEWLERLDNFFKPWDDEATAICHEIVANTA